MHRFRRARQIFEIEAVSCAVSDGRELAGVVRVSVTSVSIAHYSATVGGANRGEHDQMIGRCAIEEF